MAAAPASARTAAWGARRPSPSTDAARPACMSTAWRARPRWRSAICERGATVAGELTGWWGTGAIALGERAGWVAGELAGRQAGELWRRLASAAAPDALPLELHADARLPSPRSSASPGRRGSSSLRSRCRASAVRPAAQRSSCSSTRRRTARRPARFCLPAHGAQPLSPPPIAAQARPTLNGTGGSCMRSWHCCWPAAPAAAVAPLRRRLRQCTAARRRRRRTWLSSRLCTSSRHSSTICSSST